MVDSVRRWAAGLRNADAAELEIQVRRIAREFLAAREESARAEGERFSAFYRSCPAGVVLTAPAGMITAVNPAFLRLTGAASEAEFVGTPISALGHADEDRLVLPGGRLVRMTALPESGAFMFEGVHHDQLTGLPDGTRLRTELARLLAADAGRQVALLLVDLDGFAVVSDGLGFDVADEVLRGVARTLRETYAGHQAFVARLPGDTFAVALSGDLDRAAVGALAEETIRDLARPAYVDGIGIGVSASVGVALADAGTVAQADVIRSAQVALHRAKELGKSRWVLFDPVSGGADRERYRLACGIAGALDSGELAVVYKPHVVLPDAQVVASLNVTLRWHHPTLGELRPEQFYPLAEATGMTVPLGKFLLAEALRTAGDWRARFGGDAPLVCLTLPRRMAIDGDLVRTVQAELDRNGLEHRHVMLCTDGPALLDERGDLLEALGELARAGVVFVVYITGMPELELLPALQVPAPAVMLTGPIIDALEIDAPPAWAVRNIRQLAERAAELDIKVGAHGVLSQEHADLLFGIGVAVGAGPYLPTYASSADAETWVGRVFPMG